MDGSQKLPQRMLDSVRWHIAHNSSFDLLALGVAGWMRYVGGVDEQGNSIEISDPLLPVIQEAVQSSEEGRAAFRHCWTLMLFSVTNYRALSDLRIR